MRLVPDIRSFSLAFSFSLLISINAMGQQTIFTVPSTDVLDAKKVYVELDASFKLNREEAVGKFSSFVPRIVVGVGRNVAVGLNLTGNIQPGPDSTTLVPTVKWKFYKNEASGVAFVAGTNFFIPVRNRAYSFGTYAYVAGSKTINRTRVSAGGYAASKNVFASGATRVVGQFGVEQTISSNVTPAADWITGRHSSGYFTPGVIYKPNPKATGLLLLLDRKRRRDERQPLFSVRARIQL